MSNTIEILNNYQPYNAQEQQDKAFSLNANKVFNGKILTRDNPFCHTTASAFVVNKDFSKVLCCYHNIYQTWSWVGGHCDGIDDPIEVAKKEAMEETSIKKLDLLSSTPISLDVLVTEGHFKNGKYVSSHVHINLCYLFVADENQKIYKKEDENSNVKWLYINKLIEKAREPCMKIVYAKILEKINNLNLKNKI